MGNFNCLRCRFRHKDNGNCTAVGGSCTAVPAAHCPLLREYLDTGLEPAMCANYKTFEDEAISKGVTFKRIVALMEADRAGRLVVTRCKDCEHAERYERADGTAGYYCGHPKNTFTYGERWDRIFKPAKKADDFCSYGEPKEGGAE